MKMRQVGQAKGTQQGKIGAREYDAIVSTKRTKKTQMHGEMRG